MVYYLLSLLITLVSHNILDPLFTSSCFLVSESNDNLWRFMNSIVKPASIDYRIRS